MRILVLADAEIAVRARKQIVFQPFLVIFERGGGFFLQRGEVALHLRRALEQGIESFTNQIDRALDLFDRRLGMNPRRMPQIFLRLRDDARDRFQPFPQIRNPFFRRREIARDQEIQAVGETLVVNERIPVRFAQFLQLEDFIVDVVTENADIDLVRAGQLREIVELLQCLANLFRIRQQAVPRLGRIIR